MSTVQEESPAQPVTQAEPGPPGAGDDFIVEVRDLRKTFPKRRGPLWRRLLPGGAREEFVAVAGVTFAIRRGEIFGLLGPNGAGKTTTIRMLCTLLEPSGGTATVAGFDLVRQPARVRESLGAVLTGERSIYWKLTARENLEYFAALYHIPPHLTRARIDFLLERLGLASRADDFVERYSSGMKQRLAIAKALLANPPLVLLDEPTIGLDPQSARNLRELILETRGEGHTLLLTTHYMEEADQLCDRIGIIDAGRIIALDTPHNLKRAINRLDILKLEVEGYDPALTATLRDVPGADHFAARYSEAAQAWLLTVHAADSREVLPRVIDLVAGRGGRIRELQTVQPSLEDVFISLTGRQLRE